MRRIPLILLVIIFCVSLLQVNSFADPPDSDPTKDFIRGIARINSATDHNAKIRAVKYVLSLAEAHGARHLIDILENTGDFLRGYFTSRAKKQDIERVRATAAYLLSEIRIFEDPGVIKGLLVTIFIDKNSPSILKESAGAAISSLFGLEYFDSEEFRAILDFTCDAVEERQRVVAFLKPELFLLMNIGSLNEEVSRRSAGELLTRSESAEDLIGKMSLFDLLRGVFLFDRYQPSMMGREKGFNIIYNARVALERYAEAIIDKFLDQGISGAKRAAALTVVAAIKEENAIPVLRSLGGRDDLGEVERFAIDNAYGLIAKRVLARRGVSDSERTELILSLSPLIGISPPVAYELSRFIRASDAVEPQRVAATALRNNRDYFVSLLTDGQQLQLYRAYAAVAISTTGVFDEAIIRTIKELSGSSDGNTREIADEALDIILEGLRARQANAFFRRTRMEATRLLSLSREEIEAPSVRSEGDTADGERPRSRIRLFLDGILESLRGASERPRGRR